MYEINDVFVMTQTSIVFSCKLQISHYKLIFQGLLIKLYYHKYQQKFLNSFSQPVCKKGSFPTKKSLTLPLHLNPCLVYSLFITPLQACLYTHVPQPVNVTAIFALSMLSIVINLFVNFTKNSFCIYNKDYDIWDLERSIKLFLKLVNTL